MAIGNISDGEDGLDVRTKLNLSIDQLNTYTGGQADFTGAGATSSTKTAEFKNSASEVSLTILDDGSVYNLGGGSVFSNTAYGKQSLVGNTLGRENAGLGYRTLFNNDTGNFNSAVGYTALLSNIGGDYNTGIGHSALTNNTEGLRNTASGYFSLNANTTGNNNTSYGSNSLEANTEGFENVAVGYLSLKTNIDGTNNTAIGSKAGNSSTGDDNIFLGYNSGFYETASDKLFIDNQKRLDESDGRIKALVYGEFASTVAAQRYTINASVGVAGSATATSTLNVSGLPTSSAGLVSGDVWNNSGVLTII